MTLKPKQPWLTHLVFAYGLLLAVVLTQKFVVDFLLDPTDDWWRFWYLFTYQTNIMVASWSILYGLSAYFNLKELKTILTKKILVVIITVNTLIVFFIVFFVLNPVLQGRWNPFSSLSELLTHNLSTVIMVMVFVLVPGEGQLKNRDAITVLIYPFIYFLIHTYVGVNFTFKSGDPAFNYGFINPANYSSPFLFALVFMVLVGIFGALGFGLIRYKSRQPK
jgi:hypothetical protein